jgi:hypothetical protein
MLARLFAVVSLAALAVATPLGLRDGQCNTGNIQCCQSSTSVSSEFLFVSAHSHDYVDFYLQQGSRAAWSCANSC